MAQVFLREVTKEFAGDVVAVDNVTLDIADKELLVLVGPSGCGKSTTLRMIAGLEEITRGTIEIDGRVVNHVPPKDRDIAMVFQNYALYPHMSVYKNMAFGLKLRKFPKTEIDQRVQEAATMLGIEDLLDRKPKQLSGGQRQRVAVGRAIVRKPKVFLFDEPLSNLDAKLRVEMRAELKKLHQRLQTTMVYVTHDQVEAMTLGDRIVIMNKGKILQAAPPLDVYDSPRNLFVAGFIGTPPMNLIKGLLEARGEDLWFTSRALSFQLPAHFRERLSEAASREVTMGIRPESMRPANGNVDETSCFSAVINVIEPLGDQTLIYLSAGDNTLVGRIDARAAVGLNETVRFTVDLNNVHIFDMVSGKNLTSPPDHE